MCVCVCRMISGSLKTCLAPLRRPARWGALRCWWGASRRSMHRVSWPRNPSSKTTRRPPTPKWRIRTCEVGLGKSVRVPESKLEAVGERRLAHVQSAIPSLWIMPACPPHQATLGSEESQRNGLAAGSGGLWGGSTSFRQCAACGTPCHKVHCWRLAYLADSRSARY